jgi:hypothetical protein
MSIYELPPLTQTSERTSGKLRNALRKKRLAEESVQRVIIPSSIDDLPPVSYLPTHDSLRFRINHIHTVLLVQISERLAEVVNSIRLIEQEYALLVERQRFNEERKDDLAMVGRTAYVKQSNNEIHQLAELAQAKNELYEQHEQILAERLAAMVELEQLEEEDFALLQPGRL